MNFSKVPLTEVAFAEHLNRREALGKITLGITAIAAVLLAKADHSGSLWVDDYPHQSIIRPQVDPRPEAYIQQAQALLIPAYLAYLSKVAGQPVTHIPLSPGSASLLESMASTEIKARMHIPRNTYYSFHASMYKNTYDVLLIPNIDQLEEQVAENRAFLSYSAGWGYHIDPVDDSVSDIFVPLTNYISPDQEELLERGLRDAKNPRAAIGLTIDQGGNRIAAIELR
jgi:hypothetical protein